MTERTVVLLRHAKSDWSQGASDLSRPLGRRGRRQASQAARWLADNLATVDLAVVSPARRARSTWELASAPLGSAIPTRLDDRVYAASVNDLLDIVRRLPEPLETVVLVGHNPGLHELVARLTGVDVPMPTSALAVVEVSGPWSGAGHSPTVLRASGRPPGPAATAPQEENR
jgi:phosphohistidine phosphatase